MRKRKYTYIRIYLLPGHFAVQQKLTEHCMTGHCKSTVIKNFFFKRETYIKINEYIYS